MSARTWGARRPDAVGWLVIGLTLLALALRVWRLDSVPPGFRDDELSNALVLSQKVLDGDWQLYFPDASGHEGLYHTLVAGLIALFGRIPLAIRGISVLAGTLTVPLTYRLGARLFDRRVGLIAAAALTVSFWSLMYSRTGIRHISSSAFMLLGALCLWTALNRVQRTQDPAWRWFAAAGAAVGVGFYTYFAARGVPLIFAALALYLAAAARPLWRRAWRGLALAGLVMTALALPLVVVLNNQPEGLYRVEEVAKPLTAAREGDWSVLGEHVVRTFNMFHSDGDDEFLYNVPFRPIFHPIVAVVFWAGVALALYHALRGLLRAPSPAAAPHAFLLLWWLAGISPSFISVPAGSLGHTILAQSPTYLLLALPVGALARRAAPSRRAAVALIAGALLVGATAARDLPDYFVTWPNLGQTRFLYRADSHDVARYLATAPDAPADFGITGLLAGPWDRLALALYSDDAPRARWFDPQRALLLATDGGPARNFHGYPLVAEAFADYYVADGPAAAGGYRLGAVRAVAPGAPSACFGNGLCVDSAEFDPTTGRLNLIFTVARPLDLPPMPVVSFPPPPGVYDGPRLAVFAHWRDADGAVVAGDDGLWIDPLTLHPGDRFIQRHQLPPAAQTPFSIAVGLYDPLTGARVATDDGRDQVVVWTAP